MLSEKMGLMREMDYGRFIEYVMRLSATHGERVTVKEVEISTDDTALFMLIPGETDLWVECDDMISSIKSRHQVTTQPSA